MCYKVQIQVVDDSMANRWRIAHDSYVNHALLSYCYDESTLDSIHHFGCFLLMVTLDSIHDSNRRWIVWWVVRRLAITWLPAVDEPDSWRCWKPVSGCAGNASRPRNKLRPVHRFRMKERRKQDLLWLNGVNFALCTCVILMHAVKTEPARSGGFRWFVACFTGFPSKRPEAVLAVRTIMILC